MDYFQGVVTEYLRADRAMFVNTECLIQLEVAEAPAKGRHWFCDAVAVNFRESTVYLCEVTYSATLHSLLARLQAWDSHWDLLWQAIVRDCGIPMAWAVRPWVFIPEARHPILDRKLGPILDAARDGTRMPRPKITYLESVTPWKYRTWDRRPELLETETSKT